jgi:hypothetical protein
MGKFHFRPNEHTKRAINFICGSSSNHNCSLGLLTGTSMMGATEPSAPTIYLKFTSDNGETQQIKYIIEKIIDNETKTNINSFTFSGSGPLVFINYNNGTSDFANNWSGYFNLPTTITKQSNYSSNLTLSTQNSNSLTYYINVNTLPSTSNIIMVPIN